jgi:hypothetical protein
MPAGAEERCIECTLRLMHVEKITRICDPGVPALAGEYLPGPQNGALHAPYGLLDM